jgi:hypothetical protein
LVLLLGSRRFFLLGLQGEGALVLLIGDEGRRVHHDLVEGAAPFVNLEQNEMEVKNNSARKKN